MSEELTNSEVGTIEDTGSEEIRPCLIGGFHAVSDMRPPYFNSLTVGETCVSVDAVRLGLRFVGGSGQWLMEHADTFPADDMRSWTNKIKAGKYLTIWTYDLGLSSLTLGVGLFTSAGTVDMTRGFLDFNPNKVACDQQFWALIEKVARHTTKSECSRYDLAVDVPFDRNACRLSKDRRAYRSYVSSGITEELGTRNSVGHVRVYDKAAEAGLAGPLTRIELTCSGNWSTDAIAEHWPTVHAWTNNTDDNRAWLRVMGMLLSEKVERGEEVESYIAMLGRSSRQSVRDVLRTSAIELPAVAAEYGVNEVRGWEKLTRRDARR